MNRGRGVTRNAKPAGGPGGLQPRSRSPIGRQKEPSTTDSNDADGQQSLDEQKAADVKPFKYTGRPGEKKFSSRCRLFVASLPSTTTEEELKEMFGEFGDIGEVFVHKEKGFGFIRMDYRHNAETAKLTLDKKLIKGRSIHIQFATNASAIELHGLDNYASNDFIARAMSTFGPVERCVVVCDDRGRSKGYAIVEFEWKKSALKVLDRLKDEMFVLGKLPKPVFAKPAVPSDVEEGVREEALERVEGLEAERAHNPRFVPPSSFEYDWAKKWRDLFIEEQDKKARLEQEMVDAKRKLEFEMEAAMRQQETSRIREELERKQEQLRMMSEDMMRRQEADMQILERSRQRELAVMQGHPAPAGDEHEMCNQMQLSRENAARQQDFLRARQRAEMMLQNENMPFNDRLGGQQRGGGGGSMFQNYHAGPGGPNQGRQSSQMQSLMDYQGGEQRRGIPRENMPPRDSRDVAPRSIPPGRDLSVQELMREAPTKGGKPAVGNKAQ